MQPTSFNPEYGENQQQLFLRQFRNPQCLYDTRRGGRNNNFISRVYRIIPLPGTRNARNNVLKITHLLRDRITQTSLVHGRLKTLFVNVMLQKYFPAFLCE